MLVRSIRWRFMLWLAFLLIALLTGLAYAAFNLHRNHEYSRIHSELNRHVIALSGGVRQPVQPPGGFGDDWLGDPSETLEDGPLLLPLKLEQLFNPAESDRGLYYAIWSSSGVLRRQGGPAPAKLSKPVITDSNTAVQTRRREEFREAWHFTERGDCILVGRSIADDIAAIQRFGWLLGVASLAIFTVALGGGDWLVKRALTPVNEISATADRIAAGDLSKRIDLVETDSELGQLARVLNGTFARLETTFQWQQRFTADASHELRTPLAVLISEAQLTLNRERTPEQYKHSLAVCLDSAQQMRKLTESLLTLARFDAGREELNLSAIDLAEHARVGIDRIQPLAAKRGIQIHCDLAHARALADPDRLGQVITNLLANAVAYNHEQGQIRVITSIDQDAAILSVFNTGQAISEQDLPSVFERFYRADKSRTRSEGGCGLGLAICKATIEAHGGTITVSSQPDRGTTFEVRLPQAVANIQ